MSPEKHTAQPPRPGSGDVVAEGNGVGGNGEQPAPEGRSSATATLTPRAPRRSPSSRWWALALGVALLGIAFVAGREVWVHTSAPAQPSWVQHVVRWVVAPFTDGTLLAVGVCSGLLALFFLVSALLPARKTHVQVAEEPQLWMDRADIARAVRARVVALPGVKSAQVVVKRRRVQVWVTAAGSSADTTAEATASSAAETTAETATKNPTDTPAELAPADLRELVRSRAEATAASLGAQLPARVTVSAAQGSEAAR